MHQRAVNALQASLGLADIRAPQPLISLPYPPQPHLTHAPRIAAMVNPSEESSDSGAGGHPLTIIDLSGHVAHNLGDAGLVFPGFSDGPNHTGTYHDDTDWNDPNAADLADTVGPFALNGESFTRPDRETIHFMGDYTKFQRVGDTCKFFVGYPWNVPHMRDMKPQWWTGVVRMDCTLARVILSLQCINPPQNGTNNMSAEDNVRDWFDFATQPADPWRPTWKEIEMKKVLWRVYEDGRNREDRFDLRQVAVVAVARMLLYLTVIGDRDVTTADYNGLTVNVRNEAAMRVSTAPSLPLANRRTFTPCVPVWRPTSPGSTATSCVPNTTYRHATKS